MSRVINIKGRPDSPVELGSLKTGDMFEHQGKTMIKTNKCNLVKNRFICLCLNNGHLMTAEPDVLVFPLNLDFEPEYV